MLTRLIYITPGTEFTWMTESIIHCVRAYTVLSKWAYRGTECGRYTVIREVENNYLRHYVMQKKKICVFLEVQT